MKSNGVIAVLAVLLVVAVSAIAVKLSEKVATPGQISDISQKDISGKEQSLPETDKRDSVSVPIVMYHQVSKDRARLSDYVISTDELEEDIKYLKANGYTTVLMKDVTDYVYDGKKLPEKPIILTFDDGNLTFLFYVCQLLQQYGEKAVVSVIGNKTDEYSENGDRNLNYACLTWDDVKRLSEWDFTEVQCHSYGFHSNSTRNGASKLKGESDEDYRRVFTEDTEKFMSKMALATDVKATTYTYPYGAISDISDDIVKALGFKASLSCYGGISELRKGDTECLYSMKRMTRFHGTSLESLIEKWG